MRRDHFSCMYPIVGFVACALVFLSCSRLALIIWQIERVTQVDGFWWFLLQGIRFVVVLLAPLVVIPVLFTPLISMHQGASKVIMAWVKYYLIFLAWLLIFIEFITPNFIGQYDFRPNILLIEYLAYSKEVLSMLIKAVPLQLFLAITATALLVWHFSTFLGFLQLKTAPSITCRAPLFALMGVLLCVAGARSTLGHRPVNLSTVVFSSGSLVNSLPLSSAYSVAFALYEKIRHEKGGKPFYGEMFEEAVLAAIHKGMLLPKSDFLNSQITTLHAQHREAGAAPLDKKI